MLGGYNLHIARILSCCCSFIGLSCSWPGAHSLTPHTTYILAVMRFALKQLVKYNEIRLQNQQQSKQRKCARKRQAPQLLNTTLDRPKKINPDSHPRSRNHATQKIPWSDALTFGYISQVTDSTRSGDILEILQHPAPVAKTTCNGIYALCTHMHHGIM